MERQAVISGDGSHTIYVPGLNEHYHSIHGAVQESCHVFIKECLIYSGLSNAVIFEVGFGTGLNALLTMKEAVDRSLIVKYLSVEKYPLTKEEWDGLNFGQLYTNEAAAYYRMIHEAPWDRSCQLHECFTIEKIRCDLHDYTFTNTYGPHLF